nr:vesicle transport protein SFT2B [Ipomoea batatas]
MWKSILGEDEEQQDNFFDDQEGLCAISPLQSFIVFVNPIKFAVLFTFGNLLAIGSTAFLIGPWQQLTMMLDPVRVYATAVYVGCVVLALICALWIHSKILTMLAIICEVCALVWYSLSYIPFARRMVSDVAIRLFDTEI